MKTLAALLFLTVSAFAQIPAPTPAQLAAVQKMAVRRHITVHYVTGRVATCTLQWIGGPNDPAVIAAKNEGRKLTPWNGEFLYEPRIAGNDPFANRGNVTITGMVGLRAGQQLAAVVYPVQMNKATGPFEAENPSTYAGTAQEAVRMLVEARKVAGR